MATNRRLSLGLIAVALAAATPAHAVDRDGSHDFDFVLGDWKAHLKKMLNPLTGATPEWVEYDGTSRHHKFLNSAANLEEFEVSNADKKLHMKGQTLRLYNPTSHQWSIYLLDVDKGTLGLPPVIGRFDGNRGEFIDQEDWKGRSILVRYQWTNVSPKAAHMEQAFSPDGGKTWEANWILDLTR